MGTRNQFDKTKMPTPAVQEAELSRRMTPSEKDRRIHELEGALASQIEITNTERGHAERCAQKLNALAAQPAPSFGVGVDVAGDGVAVSVVRREGALDTVIYSEIHPLPAQPAPVWTKEMIADMHVRADALYKRIHGDTAKHIEILQDILAADYQPMEYEQQGFALERAALTAAIDALGRQDTATKCVDEADVLRVADALCAQYNLHYADAVRMAKMAINAFIKGGD